MSASNEAGVSRFQGIQAERSQFFGESSSRGAHILDLQYYTQAHLYIHQCESYTNCHRLVFHAGPYIYADSHALCARLNHKFFGAPLSEHNQHHPLRPALPFVPRLQKDVCCETKRGNPRAPNQNCVELLCADSCRAAYQHAIKNGLSRPPCGVHKLDFVDDWTYSGPAALHIEDEPSVFPTLSQSVDAPSQDLRSHDTLDIDLDNEIPIDNNGSPAVHTSPRGSASPHQLTHTPRRPTRSLSQATPPISPTRPPVSSQSSVPLASTQPPTSGKARASAVSKKSSGVQPLPSVPASSQTSADFDRRSNPRLAQQLGSLWRQNISIENQRSPQRPPLDAKSQSRELILAAKSQRELLIWAKVQSMQCFPCWPTSYIFSA